MSVRLEYTLDSLREQITAKRDRRIAAAEAEYAAEADLSARRDEWRETQEARVRALSRKVKTIRDNELESFRIPSCPSNAGSYRTTEESRDREVEKANDHYAWAMRRVEALHAPSGVVSLTSNMLSDWFGL